MTEQEIEKTEEVKAYLKKKKRRESIGWHKTGMFYFLIAGMLLVGATIGVVFGTEAVRNDNQVRDRTVNWEDRSYNVTSSQIRTIQGLGALIGGIGGALLLGGLATWFTVISKKELEEIDKKDEAQKLIDAVKHKGPNFCPECGVCLKKE